MDEGRRPLPHQPPLPRSVREAEATAAQMPLPGIEIGAAGNEPGAFAFFDLVEVAVAAKLPPEVVSRRARHRPLRAAQLAFPGFTKACAQCGQPIRAIADARAGALCSDCRLVEEAVAAKTPLR